MLQKTNCQQGRLPPTQPDESLHSHIGNKLNMNQFINCFKEWFQGESHLFYKMNRKNTLQSGPFNIRVWYSSIFKSMFILPFDSFYF